MSGEIAGGMVGLLTLGLVLLVSVLLGLAAYLLPAIVAGLRGTRRQGGILVLNLLTGWTCLGWTIALVWALVEERDR
jgi:hypothetical protein